MSGARRPTSPIPPTTSPGLHGDHLDWLRSRLTVVLTVGQGAWETHPTASLPQTQRMAGLLAERGIPHDFDLWGFDAAPRLALVAAPTRPPPAALLLSTC